MPSLPPLEIQIIRGLSRRCRLCNAHIDRRSKVCRRCHLVIVALNRYPPHNRPRLICRDCSTQISYRSAYGRGRCRVCSFLDKSEQQKKKRPSDRVGAGTRYQDKAGESHFAEDMLRGGFTVASAWGSIRRCWQALRIASNRCDEETMSKYARRIRYLQNLLHLEVSDFPEIGIEGPAGVRQRPL